MALVSVFTPAFLASQALFLLLFKYMEWLLYDPFQPDNGVLHDLVAMYFL